MTAKIFIPDGGIWISERGHQDGNSKKFFGLFCIKNVGIVLTIGLSDKLVSSLMNKTNFTSIHKRQILQFKNANDANPANMLDFIEQLPDTDKEQLLMDSILIPYDQRAKFWDKGKGGMIIHPHLIIECIWPITLSIGKFQEEQWEEKLSGFLFVKYPEFRTAHNATYYPGVHIMEKNNHKLALGKTVKAENFIDYIHEILPLPA